MRDTNMFVLQFLFMVLVSSNSICILYKYIYIYIKKHRLKARTHARRWHVCFAICVYGFSGLEFSMYIYICIYIYILHIKPRPKARTHARR